MRHKSLTYATLLSACLFLLLSPAILAEPMLADTMATEKEQEQKKLRTAIQELEQAAQHREQQNTRVDELSQQLECNWTLIRAYEVCGKLYGNDPNMHVQCSATAKQNAARCLENSGK